MPPLYNFDYGGWERMPSGIFFRPEQEIEGDKRLAAMAETGFGPYHFPSFKMYDSRRGGNMGEGGGYQTPSSHLSADNGFRCLPILDVDVEVNVESTIARTIVTQTFTNSSRLVIKEANYSFPLYDGAAVVSFRCHIGDDRVLEGEVKPNEVSRYPG
jgi:Vault protein inter-alpha-trypsin domain